MAKTLLRMVQDILSAMDSDEVNTISDTTESQQVADIIKDSYEYIISSIDLPEHFNFFELVPSGNASFPTIMYLPSNCEHLVSVHYDNVDFVNITDHKYEEIEYLPQYEFMDLINSYNRDFDTTGFGNFNLSNGTLYLQWENDRPPRYYTTFNDSTLLFDAYDSEVDSTLVANKTRAFGKLSFGFNLSDTFVPNLSEKQFTLLYNEAKSQAFVELKQQANPIAERRARKGWIRTMQHKDSVVNIYDYCYVGPSYGRIYR